MTLFRSAAALGLLLAASAVQAQPAPVKADAAWARATPPRAETGALYVTLTAPVADRLVGASTPAAARAEVHEMSMQGSVMRMRQVDGVPLPAGTPVRLAPGGYHIMLMGLTAPLVQGQTVMLHLTFQASPPIDVAATVGAVGAAGPTALPAR